MNISYWDTVPSVGDTAEVEGRRIELEIALMHGTSEQAQEAYDRLLKAEIEAQTPAEPTGRYFFALLAGFIVELSSETSIEEWSWWIESLSTFLESRDVAGVFSKDIHSMSVKSSKGSDEYIAAELWLCQHGIRKETF